ncbi:MAG: DUF6465 family protein [Oscillibacter sp.]|nr:DUF6465 family protein [Oscillibacter sp.]
MSKKKDLSEMLEPMAEAVSKAAAAVSEAAEPTAKAAQEQLEKAAKAAEPTVEAAKKQLRKAAKAAEPTVEAAKKQLKKAAKAAEPTVKAAKKKLDETGKAAAAALVPEVMVQWNGHEVACADLVEQARKAYRAEHKNVIRSFKLYIKPEDGCAYYVINDAAGKIDL